MSPPSSPAAQKFIFKNVEEQQLLVFVNNETKSSPAIKDILKDGLFDKVDVCVQNVDKFRQADAEALSYELGKLTKQPTFPHVWANGTYLGGCQQTKRALKNGDLEYYLGV